MGVSISIRHIAIILEGTHVQRDRLQRYAGVELYDIHRPDIEDQIDLALLNDLHSPVKLAFVGGVVAKNMASLYGATWIADGPTVNDDLLRFWQLSGF